MRRRKDYKLPHQPIALSTVDNSGNLIVRFLDSEGHPAFTLDLSIYAARSRMAAEFALAFRDQLADKSKPSRQERRYGLSWWFEFLDELDPNQDTILAASDISTSLLRSYIAWLDKRPVVKSSRATKWSTMRSTLLWLMRQRPDLLQVNLDIPVNPFSRKYLGARPRAALSRQELDAVLVACKADIESSWSDFQRGCALIQAQDISATRSNELADLNLKDFGILLAVIKNRYGGIIPKRPKSDANGKACRRLQEALRRHGGNQRVSRFLHATAETIIPYMIAIGAQTFANPEALRNMRRDCMSDHIFLEGRIQVEWIKGRSRQLQRRSFLRNRHLSVPNLIDRALEITKPLVSEVPFGDADQLFLIAGILTSRQIRLIPHCEVVEHVKAFAVRHNLRDSAGGPLALTIASLRPTGLTLAHSALHNDVLKTQVLANHVDPNQTRRYIDRPITRAEQAVTIARLQGRFVEAVRKGNGLDLRGKKVARSSLADARNATASGFVCSDPLGGIAPGQRKGQLCTAWLGCFTCPNAVIPLEPDTLARLIRMRDALAEARTTISPDRWQLLYAPKLEIMERDVLPRFPSHVHALARAKIALMPPPPPIE